MSTVPQALVDIFREETGDRLDQVVRRLLELEAGHGGPESIDDLFRHVHSIKGGAGMLGYREAQTVAAAIEEILERARTAGSLTPEQAGPLLEAVDALREAVLAPAPPAPPVTLTSPPATSATPPATATTSPDSSTGPSANGSAPILRVPAHKVDRMLDVVGETVLHHRRLEAALARIGADDVIEDEVARGEALLHDLQEAVLQMRTLPLSSIAGGFPRAVRDIALGVGKDVDLVMDGLETQLDRLLLEGMAESIGHLLRNAVAHGIEDPEERERAGKPRRGAIALHAEPRGGEVAIAVSDDGRGVPVAAERRRRPAESLIDVLATPGFSTAEGISDLAGRGVGLDAVRAQIEGVGGSVEVSTEPGRGTCVTLVLPVTLAVLRVLVVERGGQRFGLPLTSVSEAMAIGDGPPPAPGAASGHLAIADLAQVLGGPAPDEPGAFALRIRSGSAQAGLACERIVGEDEVLVRPLGFALQGVAGYLGAAILQDGSILLILDPGHAVRTAVRLDAPQERSSDATDPPAILVVDDERAVRELQRGILDAAGYRVRTVADADQALAALERDPGLGLVLTDVQMPGMDGFRLIEAIRARGGQLPVVIVSSQAGSEDRARGLRAGADAYIAKDEFDPRTLLETVGELLAAR